MNAALVRLLPLVFMLVACAQLPPTPEDLEAKRFAPVPGKAVIYLVRSNADVTYDVAGVMLDDRMVGSTYMGTYLRLVVEPGRHKIAGFAGDSGSIVADVGPDRIYFIQQSVSRMFGFSQSYFQPIAEPYGREMVMQAKLVGG
jgi:hypothetical protein